MRGKVVNLCLGFLNILFGALIALFTIKVPQDITLLTIQEKIVVDNIIKGIYVVMFLVVFIDLIQSFNHRADTTFNLGYILGIFALSFLYIKQPFVAIFSLLSGLIVLRKSIKENLIELDSTTMISIAILLIGATVVLGFFSFSYASWGERIKNKENKNEQKYSEEFFKYVTELDIPDTYINVKKDGKYGYINNRGETVIDFKYDYASPFIKIMAYEKNFQVALVCKDGSTYIIMKNERVVLSYRTETADENYGAKIEELRKIYTNTLKQSEPMEFEISSNLTRKNKVPAYHYEDENSNTITFDYNEEYDLVVTKSTMGVKDIYELVKKENPSIKITLETENLDYDDNYLYLFENGTIPCYEISKSKQGWYTNYGKKNEIQGKAQILEFFNDGRIILRRQIDNCIFFSTPTVQKLSDNYYDLFICGDGRYIVKDNDNYFKIIDNDYNQVFEKKYPVINPRFIGEGLYLVLDSTDNIKFNDYGYAIMNWKLVNYNGDEIVTDIENIYDLNLKIDKVKKIDEENYLIFITNLKELNYDFVGNKFYIKKNK